MYAVIETGGTQFTVEEGTSLKIPRIDGTAGDKVTLDKVLLIANGDKPIVGTPYLDNASVEAELVTQDKEDKVLIYKYKRRTKYRRTQGHRQDYTEVKITKINAPS